MRIYSLGSLNLDYVYKVDHFVRAGETLSSENMQIFPGGKGLNQSISLAKAGCDVIHGGLIGSDGRMLVDTMKQANVDVSRVMEKDSSTGHAIIQVNTQGQNCILLFAGTNHLIDKEYVDSFLEDAKENDVLLLQNEISCLDYIFECASKKKMQIAFNPSPFNDTIKKLPLDQVAWWFCNEIEGEELFGSSDPDTILDNFLKLYPNSNLVLTLGKRGAAFVNKDTRVFQPIYDAPVVDTTAAGDTFTGYFLNAVTNGKDAAYALKIASKASAIAVSRQGASVSIPTFDEVNF